MALRKVKLYGELGKRYGKEFTLDVNSPRDAIRLLSANFPDLPKYLYDHSEPGYHVIVGENSVGEKELLNPAFGSQEIKIIPVVMGSGDDGLFQVVLWTCWVALGLEGSWGQSSPSPTEQPSMVSRSTLKVLHSEQW
jgi:predicted phage tail protein